MTTQPTPAELRARHSHGPHPLPSTPGWYYEMGLRNLDGIRGRLINDARDDSDAEIDAAFSRCAPWLAGAAKALRDAGIWVWRPKAEVLLAAAMQRSFG